MSFRPQVEALEQRLTPTTNAADFVANVNANMAIIAPTIPTSNIDATQVDMTTQQDAGTFAVTSATIDAALAAGPTMTVGWATSQRNALQNQQKTLLVEANKIRDRLLAINDDIQSSGNLIGALKACGYANEVAAAGQRIVEIKNELAKCEADMLALEKQYPTMPPRPPISTINNAPFNPSPGTTLPPAPSITPSAWGD